MNKYYSRRTIGGGLALVAALAWQPASAAICSVPSQYSSIQSAIDDVTCDEINIAAGTYFENLEIDRNIERLSGQGMDKTIIDGNSSGRVIDTADDTAITISNLTIRNGQARTGAGFYNGGVANLNHVAVVDNRAVGADGTDGDANRSGGSASSAFGGGIHSSGRLTMNHSIVERNEAIGGKGGNAGDAPNSASTGTPGSSGTDSDCPFIGACPAAGNGGTGGTGTAGTNAPSGGWGGDAVGGGIYSTSFELELNYTTVRENLTTGGNGGTGGDGGKGGKGGRGGTGGDGDTAALRQCAKAGNGGRGGVGGTGGNAGSGGFGGVGDGGGIHSRSDSTRITNSVISDNHASGGTLGNPGSPGAGGSGGNGGSAGSANGCTSGSGGSTGSAGGSGTAISITCPTEDPACNVTKSEGGGLHNRSDILTLTRSSIYSNSADLGGGIRNEELAMIANVTLSGNTATDNGGGISSNDNLEIANTTIVNNSAPAGAGVYNADSSDIFLGNSIVANNTGSSNCGSSGTSGIASEGSNISTDGSCELTSSNDKPNTDPKLGPLALNQSTTSSHAPLDGSPAIDSGNNSICTLSPVNGQDQRGVGRPISGVTGEPGGACDIGSIEFKPDTIAGNPSFAGLWWEPATSGQGINLWQRNDTIFGAWYLYDQTGQDLWVTFSGTLVGGALTGDLILNSGTPLGKPWDVSANSNTSIGTMTLLFVNDTQASFTYNMLGQTGSLNLEPFAPTGDVPDGEYAGFWWNPAKSGQGLNLWHKDDSMFGAWFLYDELGNATWTTFSGTISGSSLGNTDLIQQTGPALGTPWDANTISPNTVGSVSIDFGADSASFNYTFNGISGSLEIIPFY